MAEGTQETGQEGAGIGLLGNSQAAAPDPQQGTQAPEGQANGQAPANGNAEPNGDGQKLYAGQYKTIEDWEKGHNELRNYSNELKQKYDTMTKELGEVPANAAGYFNAESWKVEELAAKWGLQPDDLNPEHVHNQRLAAIAEKGRFTDTQWLVMVEGLAEMVPEFAEQSMTDEELAAKQQAEMEQLGSNWQQTYGNTITFLRDVTSEGMPQGEAAALESFLSSADGVKAAHRMVNKLNKMSGRPMNNANQTSVSTDGKGLEHWFAQIGTEEYRNNPARQKEVEGKVRALLKDKQNSQ